MSEFALNLQKLNLNLYYYIFHFFGPIFTYENDTKH